MGFLGDIWNGMQEGLEGILRFYEGLLEPLVGQYAWGLSIILLTVTVRVFLIPLMVRQTRSMRAMQQIQPQMKRIQEKYKTDKGMRTTDPERYKKMKEKQREKQMELYQENGVNPVGGCLPLLLQMPIFFALFRVLQDEPPRVPELATAPFFGIDNLAGTAAAGIGIGAFVLVVLQVVTTFYSQKQMQARNTTASGDQAQAQKIMLYIMPAFLGYLSFTFPIGVVLYWVTTNFWTIGQQFFIFRKVEAEEEKRIADRKAKRRSGRTTSVTSKSDVDLDKDASNKGPSNKGPSNKGPSNKGGVDEGKADSAGSGIKGGATNGRSKSNEADRNGGRPRNGVAKNGVAKNGAAKNGAAKNGNRDASGTSSGKSSTTKR